MLLVIDIGNTNIKYGVFKEDELVASFRVSSILSRTADEYGSVLINLLKTKDIDKSEIKDIVISSVIPSLNYTMTHMCEFFFSLTPLMVGAGIKTGLKVLVENPKEVGADIIANCVSAFNKYGKSSTLIIIDFGTATTFDVVSEKGELFGVVIAPGIKTSLEGLVKNTAQLPMIEISAPNSILGKNTKSCMQAGIVFGFSGLVKNIIEKIKKEIGKKEVTVVATGGLGQIIAKEVKEISIVDRTLTLEGLKTIYKLNKK